MRTWFVRARWILVTVFVGVPTVAISGCNDSPGLAASFDYAMPARFEVPELRAPEEQGEYEIYVDGPLQPDTWRVRVECVPFDRVAREVQLERRWEAGWRETRCDGFEYEFPAEGEYSVSLVVEDSSGEERSRPKQSWCGTC